MKKILFTGFMASILMASGAYAVDANSLTTKGYVDAAAKWAKDAAVDYTDDVVGNINAADVATAISNAAAGAVTTAGTNAANAISATVGNINATDVATAINNALTEAEDYTDDKIGDLGESSSVVDYVEAAIDGSGAASATDLTNLTGRVNTIETYSAAYTSGIDSTKVAQISTNTSDIADLQGKIACSDTACVLNGSGTFVPVDTATLFTEAGMETGSNQEPQPESGPQEG